MARIVHCIKLGSEAEGLDRPPYPGELGKRIFESVSKQAWADWLKHQTMLVNENRLNLADARARQGLEQVFEGHPIDWGSGKDFYTVTGDVTGWIGTLRRSGTHLPALFEYGTLDSQTTLGAIKSLQISVLENQGVQHGWASPADQARVAQLARLLSEAHERGARVVLVTSGAIAAGIGPLGLRRRPRDLETQQELFRESGL